MFKGGILIIILASSLLLQACTSDKTNTYIIENDFEKVKKEVVFKAQSAAKGASAPTNAFRSVGSSGDILMPVIQFSKVTQQDVNGEFHLPTDVDSDHNISFHLMWIPGAGYTSGNYVWKLDYIIKEEADNISVGVPITIFEDVTPSSDEIVIETEFVQTIDADAEQVVYVHVYRDVASDDADETGDVIFGEIEYVSSQRGEPFN